MPKALTILQDDPAFPDYLDFDTLRIKGREHIAKLSGEIWSDHNVHDPGITIMEVLSYAILDIGYRNQLPEKELFSRDRASGQEEDNFFTAARILSCNPLTINDLRKLILSVQGVKNAWLEITDQAEVALGIDCEKSRLRYQNLSNDSQYPTLRLNGLYLVYLELEPRRNKDLTEAAIVKIVKDILHQHRNLCEDFVEVKVLGDEEIAVCAEIETASDAEMEDTMVKILEVIDDFLSPTITYYTLEQLLVKGKTMDEIFEGRPLIIADNCLNNSENNDGQSAITCNGFIDTEELEKFNRIREIRVSDLYREILKIPEVRGIKKLVLQSFIDGQPKCNREEWCLKISEGRRPVLSSARAEFTFYKNVLPFFPDKKVVIERFKKRLTNVRKANLKPYDLDFEPPLGTFREDLTTYRSIQHDFPQVFGVGEGHLSADATKHRKAQALQLKGYLLFFDQLLTNYLSQLANIRSLFSLQPESMRTTESKRSYFAQRLSDVPQAEKLIRFYNDHSTNGDFPKTIGFWLGEIEPLQLTNEEIVELLELSPEKKDEFLRLYPEKIDKFLQLPLKIIDKFLTLPFSPEERDIPLRESIRIIRNGQFSKEVVEVFDVKKYFFVLKNQDGKPFLKSKQIYDSYEEADEDAETLSFLGTLEEAYHPHVRILESRKRYTFEILHNPLDYWTYLNKILETEAEYLKRRDAFLNHLLARFSEHFTDYVLLMFALNGKKHDLKKTVQDKSNFLYHYPEISRNRGRAYNYRDESGIWNTTNISGFERRVTAMMGIPDFHRQNLSNFQVLGRSAIYYYRLFHQGLAVFISRQAYATEAEAKKALKEIYNLSKNKDNYERIDCNINGAYTFKLVGKENNEAYHPGTYPSREIREKVIEKLADELFLNIYPPITTIDPTVQVRRPPEFSSNPNMGANLPEFVPSPRRSSRSQLRTDPTASPSTSDPTASGPTTDPGSSGPTQDATNTESRPPGNPTDPGFTSLGAGAGTTSDPTNLNVPANPVTPPYTFTGNIFVKIDDCDILNAPPAYRYRIIDEDDLCATHPEYFSADDYEDKRAELLNKLPTIHDQYCALCLGENRIVVRKEGKYYFQLIDKKTHVVLWQSCASFPSSSEAYEAFKDCFFELIELARMKENIVDIEVDGKQMIFLRKKEGDYPAEIPEGAFETGKIEEAKKIRLEHAQRFPVAKFGPIFKFRLVDLDANLNIIGQGDWVGNKEHEDPIAAWFEFINCLELILDEENWLQTGEACKDNFGLGIGEMLLESEFSFGSEHDAWEATKGFVAQFKEDNAIHTFTDFWSDCYCTFQAVSKGYRLAIHPQVYNTAEEREVVLDCLRKSAQSREKFFALVNPKISRVELTNPEMDNCYAFYICSESGEVLWQGYQTYKGYDAALKAYEAHHIEIMNLARESHNYNFKQQADQCRIVLSNQQQEIVAVIPQLFTSGESDVRLKEIIKRIKWARQFPIKSTSIGFRFDIYDFNFNRDQLLEIAWEVICGNICEDYCPQAPETVPPATSQQYDCGQKEKLYLVQCLEAWIGGGVVLESTQVYSSQEEIYSVIKWLGAHQYLFRQYDSYQPTQTKISGPFSLEWVNPAGILAVNPRRYVRRSDCLLAMERAREKVNTEGLHLVEHLLLRPVKVLADRYLLKVKNEQGKVLLYSTCDYVDIAAADNDKTSFINQVKAAAKIISQRLNENQVPDHEWQQKLSLQNGAGETIATSCQLPLNKEVFKQQIDFLQNLDYHQNLVVSCSLKEKSCNEMLLEICVDPNSCGPQTAPETIERCGFKKEVEENIFEGYIHGADPYSFWVTVLIPAWSQRFQNTNFRSFFENTIRRELPAYVAPRILWINPGDMKRFELAYRTWLCAKSEVENLKPDIIDVTPRKATDGCINLQMEDPPTDSSELEKAMEELNKAQKALIQILFGLTNEYRTARLQKFESGGDRNLVLLNQTKLI
ncbi:MAG: hypothetical protein DHS20C18_34780 [Saprospiraceae bacterium]|nr:MAG: hypothetical protein DHS20C18_34780 [Saprospiraceae bacterium]